MRFNVNVLSNSELWLEWIQDEMKFSENRQDIYKLFDKAVDDYQIIYKIPSLLHSYTMMHNKSLHVYVV